MPKKLNIITMNEQKPIKKAKKRKLTILTTNEIELESPEPMKTRPEMNPDDMITTENVEKHQAKLDAQIRMAKARAKKKNNKENKNA